MLKYVFALFIASAFMACNHSKATNNNGSGGDNTGMTTGNNGGDNTGGSVDMASAGNTGSMDTGTSTDASQNTADLAQASTGGDDASTGSTDSGSGGSDGGTTSNPQCFKVDTDMIGVAPETVAVGGALVTIEQWDQKTDSEDYCGFLLFVEGEYSSFSYTIKAGTEEFSSTELVGWTNPNGCTGPTVKGISHVIFCVTN